MRWGIELVFKRWKSGQGLGHSQVKTNKFRQMTELYAKLLGCLVTHWCGLLRAGLLTKLSWHRILKCVRKRIETLKTKWNEEEDVKAVLEKLVKRLNRLKPRPKRKKKPSTIELLEQPELALN